MGRGIWTDLADVRGFSSHVRAGWSRGGVSNVAQWRGSN